MSTQLVTQRCPEDFSEISTNAFYEAAMIFPQKAAGKFVF